MNSKLSRYGNKKMLLFILLCCAGIFLLWYFFHPLSPHNERTRYVAAFAEIGPTEDGKNVKIGGIPKGRITRFHKTNTLIYVQFEVVSSVRIPKDSRLIFASAGFLGNREIEIVLGESPEFFKKGDTIFATRFDKGMNTAKADLRESIQSLQEMLDTAKAFINDFTKGKDGEQIQAVTSKGKRLVSQVSSDGKAWKASLDSLFGNLSCAVKNLESSVGEISGQLSSAKDSGKASLEKLEQLLGNVKNLKTQLSDVLASLDQTDNSAGLILQKGGELDATLSNLTKDIGALIRDIKRNGAKLNVDFF